MKSKKSVSQSVNTNKKEPVMKSKKSKQAASVNEKLSKDLIKRLEVEIEKQTRASLRGCSEDIEEMVEKSLRENAMNILQEEAEGFNVDDVFSDSEIEDKIRSSIDRYNFDSAVESEVDCRVEDAIDTAIKDYDFDSAVQDEIEGDSSVRNYLNSVIDEAIEEALKDESIEERLEKIIDKRLDAKFDAYMESLKIPELKQFIESYRVMAQVIGGGKAMNKSSESKSQKA